MATISEVRDRGVNVRDIAVVARDLDPYEQPLTRAAIQYGVTPVFWTQLRVTRTEPYALVKALCTLFADGDVAATPLLAPLTQRWAPPTDAAGWPLEQSTIHAHLEALPSGRRSIAEWAATIPTHTTDERLTTYCDWLQAHCEPEPTPETVGAVLGPSIDAYRETSVPARQQADAPALMTTETAARATVRVTRLVEQVTHKYDEWLADGTVSRSWDAVRELCELLATQRPGRREHSNARAIDIMEANDVWALSVPIVIAVGATAAEWPAQTDSVVPAELQEAVLSGAGETDIVAPRTMWGEGRDRDHFADAMRAAERGVIVTRYTQTGDGDDVHPSPFLASLNMETVSGQARTQLVSTTPQLPPAIAALLPASGDSDPAPSETSHE
ncbi:hypothetical protein DJ69_12880 [Halorubrum persicum]|uniref:Uncharacterized protein n=1 Tax=Halorubrum persicum TaxID=1383844 RepID=A0A2G1WGZ9_9EURY|nr:hypothetical protein [Halorubrum persicum]PHQ38240.1 hypothetical protein DJ69_12880 [Halorubrum persicum]